MKKIFYFILFTLTLLTPLIIIHFQNLFGFPTFIEADSPRVNTTDILAFFYAGKLISSYYYSLAMPFVGFAAIILVPYFLLQKQISNELINYKLLFLTTAFVFILLSLGKQVNFMGKELFTSDFLPFSIIQKLPILTFLRLPARFSLGVNISLAVMTAFGFKFLIEKLNSKNLSLAVFVFFIFLSIIPNFLLIPKLVINNVEKISYLKNLGNYPNGTVLYLPFGFQDSFDQPNGFYDTNMMLSQTIHKKPIIGGYLSHVDKTTLKNLHNDVFINQLLECQMEANCIVMKKDEILKAIAKFNLRYIVIDKKIKNKNLEIFVENNFGKIYLEDNDYYKILKII